LEAGVGCLFAFVFLVGELFLFSGQFREEMAGNEVASFCAFIALIFNVVFVGMLIKGIIKSAEESRERKEQEHRKQIQDEISEIVKQYTVQEDATKNNVPSITKIDNPLVDSEVVFCVKTYIREAEEQEQKIIELRAKIQKILNYNNYVTDERKLEYLKEKEPELRTLKEELLDAQKPQDNRKIVLNETTSEELEDIRNSIVESGKSQKVRNMGNLDWKTVTEVSMPVELKYFRSQTKPVMLHLMDYCFCIFSKTILVFTLEGRFVTALQRSCFRVNVQRDRERAYFNLETQSYSSNAVGTDSKCIDKGEERHTWLHTCKDGSMDLRYRNNYRINYRYDTMEYGRIRFSVADFTEEFKFSAEQAILAAEKASEENEKYKAPRENNNESSIINLLQLLEPSSKSAKGLEEWYAKLDVPQKKYCYIERS
jgi:hypothetical protein